ncbi:ABC transporter ATP-binding protein [Ferruginibacter sp. HRS2-29]|uniref:ABC transporter ATP-binding protein n=1 Tax=Ferruginibacter sp. HRS2-29 TaxID=2487334 RepID=UPI0020CC4AAC|nr:ABC transporter ATP-binding protein [Ferruginibacter sp. HRS2-29]MCP9751947.1 ABC transporter ATP-binding protein [Ferruginibacter sp. HRS2-29]
MNQTVIKVENISKQYRLGAVGTGSLAHDLNRTWHRIRGKEDPYLQIGDVNDRSQKASSDYVWALRDINFEVAQGEVTGIIGRNGAGKSTLLKILSRTTAPTTGQIKIKGRVASLLEVGTGFHPELSGRDNIFLNGAILGMTKKEIKSKFDEIVDFAGVERYIDTPVKRYSSGMYVRLAFGVAAHLEPEILIVDEVLAVGDAEFQKKALGKMKDVSGKEGRTVLFVSHNMGAISNLCNNVILLQNGTKTFQGDTFEGIRRYQDRDNQLSKETILEQLKKIEDEHFEFIDVEILQEGEAKQEYGSGKEIVVRFQYKVKKAVLGLRVGIDLIEQQSEIVLFRTFHDDEYQEMNYTQPGTYTSEMTLDSDFLNAGNYLISLSVGIHNVRWISYDSIRVPLAITTLFGLNKFYSDTRPGLIMPRIKWETKNSL